MADNPPILKEKDKPRKQRKKTTSQLKKELDKLFSEYIRRKYANKEGQVSCYTCGKTKHWKEMQCGHFVSRSYLATRFLESNVHVQCAGCNIFGGGKTAIFASKIDRSQGVGTVAGLYRKAQEIVKNFPYKEKIEEYKAKLEDLNA
jgi:hypothetical protein